MLNSKRLAMLFIAGAALGCGDQATQSPTSPLKESPATSFDVSAGNVSQENVTGHADYLLANVGNAKADYSFSAEKHRNPDVKGELEYRTSLHGGTRIHGQMVCIQVAGNSARLAARITRSDDPDAPVGMFLVWSVVDNGEGRNSPPDLTTSLFLFDEPTATRECLTGFVSLAPYFPVLHGNIQVHQTRP